MPVPNAAADGKAGRRLLLVTLCLALAMIVFAGAFSAGAGDYPLQISEVMTRNSSCPNPDGLSCDWVEIMNTSSAAVNLSGCHLTDDPDNAKFTFPAGTRLGPGECVTVYCLNGGTGTCLYTSFSLSGQGETVYLLTPGGAVADEAVLPASGKDTSLIRTDAGFTPCDAPTPGFPNTPEGLSAFLASAGRQEDSPVRLSEIVTANKSFPAPDGGLYDIIELTNASSSTADLGGMGLSDKEDEILFLFPENTQLAPGECLLVYCDSSAPAAEGFFLAPFGLRRNGGETVYLFSSRSLKTDEVTLPAMDKDYSYTGAEGGWRVTNVPTPGTPAP